ncbi:PREDICTED: phospholipase A2 inhibitor and Ly6/PLAUR domain-containing protein-like [Nanorana parkeri]|uniref:phospholipase A2 inhibitor and Ly6/PLAUR domain-containing protein-like n=1 Tax=Nanorana parkeri TaxID=125878 RepID=UPI000854EDB4|nr:PREDICTED: phospholipase A2 inhibitor and Ly6/PLAUR domain-containing protein-like [Nanorana parkeri]
MKMVKYLSTFVSQEGAAVVHLWLGMTLIPPVTHFLSQGYSLTCIQCSGGGDSVCNGSSAVCPSGNYSCLLTRVVTTASRPNTSEMAITSAYIRQCGVRDLCSKTGSITLPQSMFQSSITCCDTDNCTPPEPVLPEISGKKNGLHCPACYVQNAKSCPKETVMQCVGNETMCITQLTTYKGPAPSPTLARGCATEQMCTPAHQVWNINALVLDLENTCVNSGDQLHHLVLTLILPVSVLVKLCT